MLWPNTAACNSAAFVNLATNHVHQTMLRCTICGRRGFKSHLGLVQHQTNNLTCHSLSFQQRQHAQDDPGANRPPANPPEAPSSHGSRAMLDDDRSSNNSRSHDIVGLEVEIDQQNGPRVEVPIADYQDDNSVGLGSFNPTDWAQGGQDSADVVGTGLLQLFDFFQTKSAAWQTQCCGCCCRLLDEVHAWCLFSTCRCGCRWRRDG